MTKLKSANHHWWPKCVSRQWEGEDGKVGRMKPDGTFRRIPSDQLGAIGNGHLGKFGDAGGCATTAWDFTFEQEFSNADSQFPDMISWLRSLKPLTTGEKAPQARFHAQAATDRQLRAVTECAVSLIVRSPMNRDAFASLPERLGLPTSVPMRNAVIGMNMRGKQRTFSDAIGAAGKFAVLFSPGREFIFGDGCFNNLDGAIDPPYLPKMLVPLTPEIALIICRPFQYLVEPRISSIVLTDDEVRHCNHAIQVYSRSEIFFRSEPPLLDSAFTCGERQRYAHPDNPVDVLMRAIPGIPPRDTSLDDLLLSAPQKSDA